MSDNSYKILFPRLLAFCVDFVLIFLAAEFFLGDVHGLKYSVFLTAYFGFFTALFQTTPGKKLFGLHVNFPCNKKIWNLPLVLIRESLKGLAVYMPVAAAPLFFCWMWAILQRSFVPLYDQILKISLAENIADQPVFLHRFETFFDIAVIQKFSPVFRKWATIFSLFCQQKTRQFSAWLIDFKHRFSEAHWRKKIWMLRLPIIIVAIYIFLVNFAYHFLPPMVVVTFPNTGATEVPLSSPISIQFDRPMMQLSPDKQLSFEPKIAGTWHWDSSTELRFVPAQPLSRNQSYSLKISRFFWSTFFVPKLTAETLQFSTLGNPRVVFASPLSEAPDVLQSITVMFDRPMVPLTTVDQKNQLEPAFTVTPPVAGTGRWLGTTAYQFLPTQPLKSATTYTYTVKKGLKSRDGGVITEDATKSFSTMLPHLISMSPSETEQFADPSASVSAAFNLPIDLKSAQTHFHLYIPLEISGGGQKEVPVNVKVSGKQVGMYPLQQLERGQRYRAVIDKGLISTAGPNPLDVETSWYFTVIQEPEVIESEPMNKNTDVKEQSTISIHFATPMKESSFAGKIHITPPPENAPSFYFFSYSNNNILRINTYLGRSQHYSVTIDGSVTDEYGQPLGKDYTFSFDTAPFQPSIAIKPSGTYYASFNQAIVPRIVSQVVNSKSVSYSLYKLDQAHFLDLYRRHADYSQEKDYSNWQSYDPSDLKLVRKWTEQFDDQFNIPTTVITKVQQENGDKIPAGIYFLQAAIENGVHDNLVMVVSPTTLTLKTADNQALVWAVNQSTGEVEKDMPIQLVDQNGNQVDQGKTNQDGVFISDKYKRPSGNDKRVSLLAFAQNDQDSTVVSEDWADGIGNYEFGLSNYYDSHVSSTNAKTQDVKIHVMLDRPIYRPGQTVYFKGIVRNDKDAQYTLPSADQTALITVKDPQSKVVFSNEAALNTFGTFDGKFPVSAQGAVGDYQITAEVAGNTFTQDFQVEEYKKPDFQVDVKTDHPEYVSGAPVTADVNANFYFGAPVDHANLTWELTTQDEPFQWSRDHTFEFGDTDAYWYQPWWSFQNTYYAGKSIGEGTGTTNAKGVYEVKLPTNISKNTANQRMRLQVVIDDKQHQAIANSQEFVVHKSGIEVGVKPENYGGQVGKESRVEIVTLDIDGKELPNTPAKVSFYQRKWNSIREKNPNDGNYYWTSTPEDTLLSSSDIVTGELGHAFASFTPENGGNYRAVVEVTDAQGRPNRSATNIWISGAGGTYQEQNNDRIPLVPNKQEYQLGEKATVTAGLPYPNTTALVTVERAGVYDYQIVHTSPDNQAFNVPLQAKYSPNAFISAIFVKPGTELKDPPQIKMGIVEVWVNDPAKKLNITVTPEKQSYNPGETLKANIDVKDGNGKPVTAELALGVVDQAVWSLARAQLADIFQTFYQPRNLTVNTSQGITISMDRINANTNLGSKGGSGGGCFTGETPILMADGSYKPMAEVAPGDQVLTFASDTDHTLVKSAVDHIYVHDVSDYLIVNGKLHVTGVHRVFTQRGWITASELTTNDSLLDANAQWVKVTQIQPVQLPVGETVRVYNLQITTYHTYIAGNVWVHNQKGGDETTRDQFLDTAYWNAHIQTNADGKAQFSVKLPDNLTTWRIVSVGATKDTAVGQSVDQVVVSKDLLIRPNFPRFLSVGDEPRIGVTVHNNTDQDENLNLQISADALDLHSPAAQDITVPAQSAKDVFWPSAVKATSSAQIRVTAKNATTTIDDLKLTVPVVSYFIPQTTATFGQAADSAEEKILVPKDVVPDQGQLAVTLSSSQAAPALDASTYLLSYPYWCTEQTVAKLLPSLSFLAIAKQMSVPTIAGQSQDMLNATVLDTIQRLVSRQLPDGGWNWWADSTYQVSDPILSGLSFQALQTAKKAGFAVPDSTINKAKAYLTQQLDGSSENSLAVQAFIVSKLGDQDGSNDSTLHRLMDHRWQMSITGRVYLLQALQQSNLGQDKNRLLDELLAAARQTNTTAHWEDPAPDWQLLTNSNSLTALMLSSLTKKNANHPLIDRAVRWLMQTRKGNAWETTRDTTEVVDAMTQLLLARHETTPKYSWKVILGNQLLGQNTVDKQNAFSQETLVKNISEMSKGLDQTLSIQKSGQGSLYYNLNLNYFLPLTEVEPVDQGMVITRDLLDKKGQIVQSPVSTQDEMWVKLTIVSSTEQHNVMVEDKLPAGFEPVNENLATTAIGPDTTLENDKGDNILPFTYQEMRDDRVIAFVDTLQPGVYEYTYRVRPTIPGRYHYPPAKAYDMYLPDVFGSSAGGWLEVKE